MKIVIEEKKVEGKDRPLTTIKAGFSIAELKAIRDAIDTRLKNKNKLQLFITNSYLVKECPACCFILEEEIL